MAFCWLAGRLTAVTTNLLIVSKLLYISRSFFEREMLYNALWNSYLAVTKNRRSGVGRLLKLLRKDTLYLLFNIGKVLNNGCPYNSLFNLLIAVDYSVSKSVQFMPGNIWILLIN